MWADAHGCNEHELLSPAPPAPADTAVYRIVVQTSCAAFAGTDAYLEVLVSDSEGRKFRSGYLDSSGNDLERCQKDTYDVGTGNWVDLSTATMQVYFKSTALLGGGWTPAWIQVRGSRGRVQRSSTVLPPMPCSNAWSASRQPLLVHV